MGTSLNVQRNPITLKIYINLFECTNRINVSGGEPTMRSIPVSEHLDQCPIDISPKYQIFPLYQSTGNTSTQFFLNKENSLVK